ncbi:MAG TPA: hypothetical protein PKI05_02445 [Thermogutta sp.]|nr:hypothetical protein [Thermogutta sp.]HOP76421.1 hypothetical protein [Thermogutta sp.]HPU06153.1 hypothetical protein [Thermogutta sp.]HQF14758.1 hypothetical protein [Thermogutta sp.]
MTGSDTFLDPGFYELVHQILSNSQRRVLRERRIRPRFSFDVKQRIAPWTNSRPEEKDFIPVRCFDLNTNGVAFFLEEPPSFRRLIVELSCPQRKVYLESEVAHWEYVYLYPCGDIVPEEVVNELDEEERRDLGEAQRLVLVGCRFLARSKLCHEK